VSHSFRTERLGTRRDEAHREVARLRCVDESSYASGLDIEAAGGLMNAFFTGKGRIPVGSGGLDREQAQHGEVRSNGAGPVLEFGREWLMESLFVDDVDEKTS
jgi:hypothetical protein